MQIKIKNICLIHGWGSNIKKLKPLKQKLTKLDFNPYTPKLPYFDYPEPNIPWNNANFAKLIKKKCSKHFKNQPYYLFGHSFGGRITIKIAQNNPSCLTGVILCASAGISRDSFTKRAFFKILSLVVKPLKKIPFLKHIINKVLIKLTGNGDYTKITTTNKKETFKNIIKESQKNQSKKINLPTLIIWGKKDTITPLQDAHFLNQHIKDSKLKLISQGTHTIPYTHSDKIAKTIHSWTSLL